MVKVLVDLIDSINCKYIHISIYNLLVGCSFMKMLEELRYSTKGLINILNKDKEYFVGVISDTSIK